MYDRILIPTDGSNDADRGAEHGVGLAAALGAEVTALYVIEEGGNPWLSESMDDQLERAEAFGNEVTGEVGEMAEEAGVEFHADVVSGPSAARRIVRYAEEEDMDMIVVGTGFKGQFGDLLGSTAEKVIRSTTIPVTTIRRGETE